MADRIITVTDPSVVTNDTLAGYNNYSDIDGQLGTTMTPTEATNGKTVTLSDGVVHSVTTKPVGMTNGEFSSVVSNAVTVDLSVTFEPIIFTLENMTENPPETYIQDISNWLGVGVQATGMSGDFEVSWNVENPENNYQMVGIDTVNTNTAWSTWLNVTYNNNSEVILIRPDLTNVPADNPTDLTFTAGDKLIFKRVSDNLTLWYNDSQVHDYGTLAGTVYVHISAGAAHTIVEPRVLQ